MSDMKLLNSIAVGDESLDFAPGRYQSRASLDARKQSVEFNGDSNIGDSYGGNGVTTPKSGRRRRTGRFGTRKSRSVKYREEENSYGAESTAAEGLRGRMKRG